MKDTFLWILTAAIPALSIVGKICYEWRKCHPLDVSAAEWLERMREADKRMPLAPPRFRSKEMRTGAPGICSPLSKAQAKLTVIKKRVAK